MQQAYRRTGSLRFFQGWFVSRRTETKRFWERTVTVSSSSQSSLNTDELYKRSCIHHTAVTAIALACGAVCEPQAWRTLMDAADRRQPTGHSTQDSGTDNHVFCIAAVSEKYFVPKIIWKK